MQVLKDLAAVVSQYVDVNMESTEGCLSLLEIVVMSFQPKSLQVVLNVVV